jgi:transcriptional regulator with XRE-family HTH domain
MSLEVGKQLRSVRTAFGLSQRELAKRAGVTNGMVSLIEQDRVSPSVGSLQKILSAFPMTMAEFFTRDMQGREDVVFSADELPDVGTGDIQYKLVAASRHDRKMSILWENYAPGTDTGDDLLTHSGEEGGVVIEGEIELTVAGVVHLLGPGDAYYFDSRLPHRFRNTAAAPARIVSANTPPTI